MPLNNKQKIGILRAARENGYTGDLTKLFQEAENDGIFNKPSEPELPIIPNISLDDLTVEGSESFEFDSKSLLVDKTPHRFTNNDNFINSDHTVTPNPRAIIKFLNDPEYRPTAEPNIGADGGKKKYHEGGFEHEHPHPETEDLEDVTEPNISAIERGEEETPSIDGDEISGFPINVRETYALQEFLGVTPTGSMDEVTQKHFLKYSNNNLNNLPVYNKNWKTDKIRCKGTNCSEQTTNVLQLLYPHLTREDLAADDSWFRRDHLLSDGGIDVWSQDSNVDWTDMSITPPPEVWQDFRIGDIVHLNNSKDPKYTMDEKSAYTGSTKGNRGTEHTGFIIGKDPDSGMPLVMHGVSGNMEVDPINDISLGRAQMTTSPAYKIDGITRPKKLTDENNYNFNQLSLFLHKDQNVMHKLTFSDDYLEGLNNNDRETANFFTGFMNGNIPLSIHSSPAGSDQEFTTRSDEEVLGAHQHLSYLREHDMSPGFHDYVTPIQRISQVTGYNEAEVSKAAMMTWGFYQNETADVGFGSGAHVGKIKEYAKDSLSNKNAAKLKALKSGDINWTNLYQGVFGNWLNDEAHIESAKQEPSRGILRIKYNLNKNLKNGELSRVGQWWEDYGIRTPEQLTAQDDDENTLITGKPGKAGMANSFAASTMLTLNYYENIRRKPGYDPDSNTYKGIPIDYVVATMHKGINLNSMTGNGKTVLENLQAGDRTYANISINAANELNYSTQEFKLNQNTDEVKTTTNQNTNIFNDSIHFMNE